MIVVHYGLDGLETAPWVHFVLFMRQSAQNLHKVHVVLLQVDDLEFHLVDFLYVQEGLLFDYWLLLLVEGLADNGEDYTPAGF